MADKTAILSVGIDVGTSTTQVVFSKLQMDNAGGYFSVPRVAIVDKEVVYKSEVYMTPLKTDVLIDTDALRDIVAAEFRKAGYRPEDTDSGAVIITGESARKENSDAVLKSLSDFAGDFVVSAAGPDMESLIAGKGSGAWQYSMDHHCRVANLDIGGGTTEVAVISLGGIVTSSSLRLAGNRMDEAIAMHLRDLLGIKIGERTAEIIKIKIGSILPFEDGRERDMIISGQDVITEQPKEVTIQSEDVRSALVQPCEEMVVHIKETFKKTNPDLASDIIQNGILLTGGGGLLSGLDRYLTDKLEIPVWTSETALTNVVMGCLKVLETPTALKQTLMRSK